MKLVYMCRPKFENGGLRERPFTENGGGGFQNGPSLKNKGDFGTKNNKETYIFKRGEGVFSTSPVGKVETNVSF